MLRALLKDVAWALPYAVVPVLSLFLVLERLDSRAEKAVPETPAAQLPDGFPLVMFEGGSSKPRVIVAASLRESPPDCAAPRRPPRPPEYTNPVLSPPSTALSTEGWQQASAPNCTVDGGGYARYRVLGSAGGRTVLEVDASCDDYVSVGRYEVVEGVARGLSYKSYFGPGLAIASLFYTAGLSAVLWLLVALGQLTWRRHRRRRAALAEAQGA